MIRHCCCKSLAIIIKLWLFVMLVLLEIFFLVSSSMPTMISSITLVMPLQSVSETFSPIKKISHPSLVACLYMWQCCDLYLFVWSKIWGSSIIGSKYFLPRTMFPNLVMLLVCFFALLMAKTFIPVRYRKITNNAFWSISSHFFYSFRSIGDPIGFLYFS